MPVGFAAVTDLMKLGYEFAGTSVASDSNSDFYYQGDKPDKYEKYDAKWETHLMRMIPFLKNVYTINQPYEAAKSFEYGKSIKNK